MLIVPIRKKWFDMIVSGFKKEEYRLDNDYWRPRLPEGPIEIYLRNGYSGTDPTLKVKGFVDIGTGCEEWGAEPGIVYRKIHTEEKELMEPEVFLIRATKCKRCGGILTSKNAVAAGYGRTCLCKEREEAEARANQLSLFED